MAKKWRTNYRAPWLSRILYTRDVFRHFAKDRGVEIISLDRPGYGDTPLSHFKGVNGWTKLMENFLLQHNLDHFSIIGISGGAPFAVAVAEAFPHKIKKLGIICGLAPWYESKQGFNLSQNLAFMFYKNAPKFLSKSIIEKRFLTEDLNLSLDQLAKTLNKKDQDILAHPEVRQNFIQGMVQARRQGILGIENDLQFYCSDWKVNWKKITMPSYIWFGEEDYMLNHKMAETYKEKIPHIKIKLFPNEGHFSLPVLYAETILNDFLEME